jgi:hypothetical protein
VRIFFDVVELSSEVSQTILGRACFAEVVRAVTRAMARTNNFLLTTIFSFLNAVVDCLHPPYWFKVLH